MYFRIADTFQTNLTKLTNQEQKAVKITVFDLQADPSSPGLKFHKLDRAKDPNFWSVGVNRDIRLIVHRTPNSILITYVNHHDDAYAWAERRRIETHPRTGAAQLVEVRETVEEVVAWAATEVAVEPTEPLLFGEHPDDEVLLGYGVPGEWLADVRRATENDLFDLLEHLPQEASEALLELATGGVPTVPVVPSVEDPFLHPDAQRRFRVLENVEELERALEYPWEKWTPHCPSNLPILTSNQKNHVKSMYCWDIERGLLFTQWVQVWVGVIGGERFPIVASNIFKNMQLSIILSPFVASVNIEKYFQ